MDSKIEIFQKASKFFMSQEKVTNLPKHIKSSQIRCLNITKHVVSKCHLKLFLCRQILLPFKVDQIQYNQIYWRINNLWQPFFSTSTPKSESIELMRQNTWVTQEADPAHIKNAFLFCPAVCYLVFMVLRLAFLHMLNDLWMPTLNISGLSKLF